MPTSSNIISGSIGINEKRLVNQNVKKKRKLNKTKQKNEAILYATTLNQSSCVWKIKEVCSLSSKFLEDGTIIKVLIVP